MSKEKRYQTQWDKLIFYMSFMTMATILVIVKDNALYLLLLIFLFMIEKEDSD